jgi:hypothetical protein
MSNNIIDFPIKPANAVSVVPEYVIYWADGYGDVANIKTRSERNARIQLDNLLQMKKPALVKADGKNCGGVMEVHNPDGTKYYRAVLNGDLWSA